MNLLSEQNFNCPKLTKINVNLEILYPYDSIGSSHL